MENKNFDILRELEEISQINTQEKEIETNFEKNILKDENISNLELVYKNIDLNDGSNLFDFELENYKNLESNYISNQEKNIELKENVGVIKKISNIFLFIIKYSITSSIIFGLLLISTNYKAYFNVIKAQLQEKEMSQTKESIINSVEALNIIDNKEETKEMAINKDNDIINNSFKSFSDIKKENLSLKIDITPYENRIVIPAIGKNIPLVEIKNRTVKGQSELNNIFMQELENGVIRYPGSAKPGEVGNSFIFGHSSNFPWIKGDYNDVFALLNNINHQDEVIIYYNQKKYIYKINNKIVIKPGNVSVLKGKEDEKRISIMTCRPIGTTLNRLVISGDLVEDV